MEITCAYILKFFFFFWIAASVINMTDVSGAGKDGGEGGEGWQNTRTVANCC
jgi:hypothetical protein